MIGQTLKDRYKINSLLGEGGMGEVYLATEKLTGQQVAVKVLAIHLRANSEMLERFHREAKTLRQLDHPNIVKFVEAFEHDGQFVIVMEYVPGGSLHELLKNGPLSIEQARKISLGLCDALIRSHQLSIIHRDLKPENVLIGQDGTPKLTDFGVARLSEGTRMTQSGMKVGTAPYMSPEAWDGKVLDEQTDIWSMGVMLFEMLTSQVPFGGDTDSAIMKKVFTINPPELRKLRSDIPKGLARTIRRMLDRDKKKRYQTMRQVAVDLERAREEKTNSRKSDEFSPPTIRLLKNKGTLWLASVGVLLVAGIGILLMENGVGKILLFNPSSPVFSMTDSTTQVFVSPTGTHTQTSTAEPEATQSPTPIPELNIGSTQTRLFDGMVMVYVPAGGFFAGQVFCGVECTKPERTTYVDSFWIDKTEVTNEMYAICVNEGSCLPPYSYVEAAYTYTRQDYYAEPAYANYPVVYVDVTQAKAYCEWVGGRLPTNLEWMKAARGTDGRDYPWGNTVTGPEANFCDITCLIESEKNYRDNLLDGYPSFSPVGSFPLFPSPYGVLDIGGNVWEIIDETETDGGARGGSWASVPGTMSTHENVAYWFNIPSDTVGFRCAVNGAP